MRHFLTMTLKLTVLLFVWNPFSLARDTGFGDLSLASGSVISTTSEPLPYFRPQDVVKGDVTDFYQAFDQYSPKRIEKRRVINRKRGTVKKVSLREFPTQNINGKSIFACGSEHIRGDAEKKSQDRRGKPYMNPTSACMVMGMAQEWRKTVCPNNSPDCQLMIGDMTYGHSIPKHPGSGHVNWPHNTHREGICVDIWPVRKKGYGADRNVTIKSQSYDRARTKKLVQLMHKWGSDTPGKLGAKQIFFNDTTLHRANLTRILKSERKRGGSHDYHIHVCFRDNKVNRARCNKTQFDTRICPGLGNDLSRPSQVVPTPIEASVEEGLLKEDYDDGIESGF